MVVSYPNLFPLTVSGFMFPPLPEGLRTRGQGKEETRYKDRASGHPVLFDM